MPDVNKRVLIVDDDSDKREDLNNCLQEQGYDVVAVADTQAALDAMANAVNGKFDLVISDTSRPLDEERDPGCHDKVFSAARSIGAKIAIASAYPVIKLPEGTPQLPVDNPQGFVEAVNKLLMNVAKEEAPE